MQIYPLEITLNELLFIRQSLDIVSITGKDAKFLAGLQVKVESRALEIQKKIEEDKIKSLDETIAIDIQKQSSKK